jgi:nicotinamidase-related amidase
MTITTLDPKTALVVIDLQKGIVALPTAHPVNEVVKHAVELLDAFRSHGLPVVLVNVAGGAPGRAEQAETLPGFPPIGPILSPS